MENAKKMQKVDEVEVICTQCDLKQVVKNVFAPHPKCEKCGCMGFLKSVE